MEQEKVVGLGITFLFAGAVLGCALSSVFYNQKYNKETLEIMSIAAKCGILTNSAKNMSPEEFHTMALVIGQSFDGSAKAKGK